MKISWFTLLCEARYQTQKRHLSMEMAQYLMKPAIIQVLQKELEPYLFPYPDGYEPHPFFDNIPVGILRSDSPFAVVLVISDIPPREIRISDDGTLAYYEFGQVSPF